MRSELARLQTDKARAIAARLSAAGDPANRGEAALITTVPASGAVSEVESSSAIEAGLVEMAPFRDARAVAASMRDVPDRPRDAREIAAAMARIRTVPDTVATVQSLQVRCLPGPYFVPSTQSSCHLTARILRRSRTYICSRGGRSCSATADSFQRRSAGIGRSICLPSATTESGALTLWSHWRRPAKHATMAGQADLAASRR